MTREQKDRAIAAAITFAATLLILLFLFLGGFTFDRSRLAQSSIPEPELLDEEETFLEPEILKDLGEEDARHNDAPAPAPEGAPEPAETDNSRLVTPGDNPKPAPPVEKKITTPKESPVKATEPSVTKEERQKITSSVAKGFAADNGATGGKTGTSGAGGTGLGIHGTASGRTFRGCPKPDVELRHKTTVKVAVVIDAEGRVTSARASGGASAAIRRACEQAARGARWSPKKGAAETRGTITFTITPVA